MASTPDSLGSDNTYFIHDSGTELARLVELDRALSKGFGGLFPEHADTSEFLSPFHRVLDVACGSGGWLLELAQRYPHLQVVGIDIDPRMTSYAESLAHAGELDNASFRVMNALEPLDFPDNFFDLVNGRFLTIFPATAWPDLLQELARVTRPGGIIRLTEEEDESVTNSPAFEQLTTIFLQALKQSGKAFSPSGRTIGVTPLLGSFLQKAGCMNIQKKPLVIDWSVGREEHPYVAKVLKLFIKLIQPFLIELEMTTQEELDRLYREMEIELMSDDFCAHWYFLTVWGEKSIH
jgi:ubiquinone/menaquinone biosynthesis C-methylase UbiE